MSEPRKDKLFGVDYEHVECITPMKEPPPLIAECRECSLLVLGTQLDLVREESRRHATLTGHVLDLMRRL